MTAGVVMEKMKPKELYSYVYGIVEGMAYARFRKDTVAAGAKTETGMTCIYNWFFSGNGKSYADITAAFRKYPEHGPPVIVAALIKKKCGE
ncbi:hypothetical protein GN330_12005 [Nitratireductor sp. CAU 1489]|uniref:Rap1a immunity protein domain-containing protein n=1 Tax=Nitratireductor arenosus TaxID=2682096 RepID=A0A844QIU0_9HYPH|nr:hypothetical protein [Nitratireductor arenosus]MVA97968.1 hypothetical protein [Nitratireductor arenosus]